MIAAPATPHVQVCLELKDPVSMLLKEPFLLREDTSGTKQETLYRVFFHTVYVGTDGALFCVYEAVLCHFLKKEPMAPGLWMTKL